MRITKGTGIYRIKNTVNERVYIGSTKASFYQRWAQHRSDLRNNRHGNQYLQRAWNRYGPDAFVFEIVEAVNDLETISDREQYWIEQAQQNQRSYNMIMQVWPSSNLANKDKLFDVTLVSPRGVIYERIVNIRAFCFEHNLNPVSMGLLCRGGRVKRHRGWSLLKTTETRSEAIRRTAKKRMEDPEYRQRCMAALRLPEVRARQGRTLQKKTFAFVSPTGELYVGINNLKAFCAQHGLDQASMRSVDNPKQRTQSYHGWRAHRPPETEP